MDHTWGDAQRHGYDLFSFDVRRLDVSVEPRRTRRRRRRDFFLWWWGRKKLVVVNINTTTTK